MGGRGPREPAFTAYRNTLLPNLSAQEIAQLLTRFQLPEWARQVVTRPSVYARQHGAPFEALRRSGRLAQPGQPKLDVRVLDPGEAGDYEVIMDEDRVAMRREWFEAVFAAGDQRTRSARRKR